MKFFLNKSIFFFALLLTFASCESFIDEEINVDPNNPVTVPIQAQMPSIEINLADVYGGAFSRFNSMLTQQVEGVARQWSSFNVYTGLTPNRFDAAWQNIYEGILLEIKLARATATDAGFNHYLGVLDILEAFTLLSATDVWDDMPYSEALQGVDVISPVYDTQASIYATALDKLNKGLGLLDGSPGAVSPGADDVYYGGNIAAWILAANAVKARTLLKQDDYAGAMAAAQASFTSAADNMAYQYPDAAAAGQWYRFNRDRTADIEFHPQMQSMMEALDDTLRANVMNPTFITDHPYMVADFNQEMITYREMQFIIAEVDVRNGGTQAGYDAYLNGIRASFDRLGLDQAAYDQYVANADVTPGVGNLTLERVMIEKYIAMYLQPEVYNDWRRTNIPALTPTAGEEIPVRWHYSSDEYLFNSNSPSETDVDIFKDRVGWNR